MEGYLSLGSESESELLHSLDQFFNQTSRARKTKNANERKRRSDLKTQYTRLRILLNLSSKTSKLQVLAKGCARVQELHNVIEQQKSRQQLLRNKIRVLKRKRKRN